MSRAAVLDVEGTTSSIGYVHDQSFPYASRVLGSWIRFCQALPHRAGVAAIPSAVSYDDPAGGLPIVRFVFGKEPEVLDEAARGLAGLTAPYHQEAV